MKRLLDQAEQSFHLLPPSLPSCLPSFVHSAQVYRVLCARCYYQHTNSGDASSFLDSFSFQRDEPWIADVLLNKTWDLPLRYTQWIRKGICQHSETHIHTCMCLQTHTLTHEAMPQKVKCQVGPPSIWSGWSRTGSPSVPHYPLLYFNGAFHGQGTKGSVRRPGT